MGTSMCGALTSGQLAAAANVSLEALRLWLKRYPDQVSQAFGVPDGAARGRGWRRYRLREAFILDVVGVLVGWGSGPDSAFRLCENLSYELREVWPANSERPALEGRPCIVLSQRMHRRHDPAEIAKGKPASRARMEHYETPGQPFTALSVISASEAAKLIMGDDLEPTLVIDIARELARMRARLV
jgi:hypothetical protein